jgi:hypothetical protein
LNLQIRNEHCSVQVEKAAAPGGAKNDRSAASVRRAVLFKKPMNCNSDIALENRA